MLLKLLMRLFWTRHFSLHLSEVVPKRDGLIIILGKICYLLMGELGLGCCLPRVGRRISWCCVVGVFGYRTTTL